MYLMKSILIAAAYKLIYVIKWDTENYFFEVCTFYLEKIIFGLFEKLNIVKISVSDILKDVAWYEHQELLSEVQQPTSVICFS